MNVHVAPELAEADDIRAAVGRVVASAEFRSSPQLVAFLHFIVEMRLKGEVDRIKASVIGTEALGRAADFDAQRDPIVRVEAQRLRRALDAYYGGAGADDPIVIDVPRGGYVPVFRPRLPRRTSEPAPPRRADRRRRRLALGAVPLGLLAILATGALVLRGAFREPAPAETWAQGDPPAILMEPIRATPESALPLATMLGRELAAALRQVQPVIIIADATLARDEMAAPRHEAMSAYRIGGSIEVPTDGAAAVTLRLVVHGTVAWTRDWRLADGERGLTAIAREAAVDVASSSGIVAARMRQQADRLPSGYRCLIAASDYMRKFDLAQHERVRDCLERTVARDDTFAIAFAVLAFVYEREHVHDLPSRPDAPPALESSLKAAQRALALSPNSAIAHLVMMENLYLRGSLQEAFAAGEKALALNPLDPAVTGLVGLRLLFGGETERGAVLLRSAAERFSSSPGWLDFGLFCLAYLSGDMGAVAQYADLDAASTFPFGLAARAITAAAAGERESARRTLIRLRQLYPGWSEPRRMLERFMRSPALVDRLVRDLAAIEAP